MTSGVPWSVKGIDRKARETAKDLARKSGMTLGEWLNQMIEYQGEGNVTPLPHTANLADAVERLSARLDAAEQRSTLAITGIDQSVRGLVTRIESAEREQSSIASRLEGGLDQVAARQAQLQDRLRQLDEEAGGARTADALKTLEGSIGRIAGQVYENEVSQKDSLSSIREELAALAARLDGVDTGGRGEAIIGDAERRLQDMERSLQGVRDHVEHIEQRSTKAVERIGHEVLRMAEAVGKQVQGVELRTAVAVEKLGGDVARIADQLETRLKQADLAQAAALEKLGAEIARITETLSERMTVTERRSAQAIDAFQGEDYQPMFPALAQRVRESESRTAAFLDTARDRIEQRLEETQERRSEYAEPSEIYEPEPPAGEWRFADAAADPFAPAAQDDPFAIAPETARAASAAFGALADAMATPEAEVEPEAELEPAAQFEAQAPGETVDESLSLDAFTLAEDEEPSAEHVLAAALAAPAPVIYADRAADEADFAFASPEYDPVLEDAEDPFAEAETPVEDLTAADPFSTEDAEVETSADAYAEDPFAEPEAIDPADPFAPTDPFAPADPFESTDSFNLDQAFARIDSEAQAEAAVESAPEAEGQEFEPGPFGHHQEPAEDLLEPPVVDEIFKDDADEFVTTSDVAPLEPPVSRNEFIERARSAARNAAHDRGEVKPPSFAFGGRRRGGATMKSAAMLSTTVVVCLGAALTGVAVISPALKEQQDETQQAEAGKVALQPQAAMMTNPRPIESAAPAANAAAKPAADAGADLYMQALPLLSAKDRRGLELLDKAANLGHPQAELQLGHLYETGYPGLTPDLNQARRWTERAAQAGVPAAMHNLAMYYFAGQGGPVDLTSAAHWFRQAAELGMVDSQYNLGLLYERGKGVAVDQAEAYKWFLLASRAGDDQGRAQARAAALRLRDKLPAEARLAAERAAGNYAIQAAQ